MKSLVLLSLLVLGLCLLGPSARAAQAPSEIIVHYHSSLASARSGTHVELLAHHHTEATSEGKWRSLNRRLEALRQRPDVLHAEPNYRGHFTDTPSLNDPLAARQWWLAGVNSESLLSLGRGAGITIALIDSGVDLNHPDLASSILDKGYNFGDDNADIQDKLGHGTMVAGVITAAHNNRLGIAGLAPDARMLPVKINPGSSGSFTSLALAKAIDYAVARGANIINLSLTVENETELVRTALQDALNQGVIVIAAVGNKNAEVEFPANVPGVIAVAATDETNHLSGFSNRGPEVVVAAPGSNIVTTTLGGSYGSASGTSYAAPIVSAAIADLLSINPALKAASLATQLRYCASPIEGASFPFGRLDAGCSGARTVPHLTFAAVRSTRQDLAQVRYDLPPTGVATRIYVAARTPMGEFYLRPDGSWHALDAHGYVPMVLSYDNPAGVSGTLFGTDGIFPALELAGFPPGTYILRTALVRADNGSLIGPIAESTLVLD